MNKDFRIAVSFTYHPKTKKLMRRLGDRSFYSLVRLWSFVAMNKPNGILADMDIEDIEIAADWDGECSKFVLALLDLKLMDKINDIYSIHDWEDHNGFAFYSEQRSEKARNAAKVRWEKRNKKKDLMLNDANSIQQASPSNAPSPSPSPSPSPDKELTAFNNAEFYITKRKRKITGKRLETFMLFWEAFNDKRGKAEATDVWLDIPSLTDKIVDRIVVAAKTEARQRPDLKASGKTPKMAQGWLSGKRWEDEATFSAEIAFKQPSLQEQIS